MNNTCWVFLFAKTSKNYFFVEDKKYEIIHFRLVFFTGNYGSWSKKGEFLRFELSHNALNRKPRK